MSLTEYAAEGGAVIDNQAEMPGDEFMVLSLGLIVASAHNPRTVFNLPRLEELAASIRAIGVHTPIIVRPLPPSRLQETFEGFRRGERPAYEIIAGERRFRASKLAGIDSIPALIRHLTDEQVLKIQLVENLQRDDLHPMEEAEGYERLIQATGITKEQVGDEIGKSRGYVYGRLKLLELCQEARKAFYEGEIDSSRALVIARVPVSKLQIKALEEATAADWQGGLRHNFKSFVRWAQQNLMLRLDAARFKITDASLLPDAGSCRDCGKRTGAQPEVYADVDSADVCTDPICYHAKEAAHEVIVIDQAREKGQQVILEKEAKAIWQAEHIPLKGYTRLDRPDARVHDTKTLKTVLGKNMPPPVLMQNPHKKGELIEVLPTAQVTKLLKESGKLAPAPTRVATPAATSAPAAPSEASKPIEQRRAYINGWQAEALRKADAHFKGWTGKIPASLLRAFLLHTFEGADEAPFGPALDLGDEFNAVDVIARLQSLPDSAMPEVFIRWMLHDTENGYPQAWTVEQRNRTEPRHPTWEILTLANVDVDEIQAATKRAIEGEDRVAEMAKADKAAKPKESSEAQKKSSAPPAAQKKRAGKPSAQEVQMQIAEQLQALDQAPTGAEQEVAADAAQQPIQAPSGANEEEGAAPAALVPSFNIGQLAKVKAGSKSAGGKALKTIGRVGRVAGLGDDGRVHLRHGPRPHELVVVLLEQLEHYAADPRIGSKVRAHPTSILEPRNKLMWREGIVDACGDDGWRVTLFATAKEVEHVEIFGTNELEVLV